MVGSGVAEPLGAVLVRIADLNAQLKQNSRNPSEPPSSDSPSPTLSRSHCAASPAVSQAASPTTRPHIDAGATAGLCDQA